MIETLDSNEIEYVAGGMDGLGPDTPGGFPGYECPNLERWKREREINPV